MGTHQDQPIPVGAKLAAAWTSSISRYVCVDILNSYRPAPSTRPQRRVLGVQHQPEPRDDALALMAIPILMVVLSMTLPARANGITNLIVGPHCRSRSRRSP